MKNMCWPITINNRVASVIDSSYVSSNNYYDFLSGRKFSIDSKLVILKEWTHYVKGKSIWKMRRSWPILRQCPGRVINEIVYKSFKGVLFDTKFLRFNLRLQLQVHLTENILDSKNNYECVASVVYKPKTMSLKHSKYFPILFQHTTRRFINMVIKVRHWTLLCWKWIRCAVL